MDERAFYTESKTTREAELSCPHCHRKAVYELAWVVRKKKDKLPPRADERDRARFAKAQSYMVLIDDKVMCSNPECHKRFDVSGVKTLAFLGAESEPAPAEAQPKAQPKVQPRQEQRPNQSRQKGKQRKRGGQQDRRAKQPGRGQRNRRDRQPAPSFGQQPGQGKSRRGDQQPDEEYESRTGNLTSHQQQTRRNKKKKRPQVYFPSDYVNYRP